MAFQVPIRRGETHPFAKIRDTERVECRRRYQSGEATLTQLAREKGLSKPGMRKIVNDPRWNPPTNPLSASLDRTAVLTVDREMKGCAR